MTRMLKKFFVLLLALACLLSASALAQSAAVSGAACSVSADGTSSSVCALPHSGQNFASASSSAPQYLQFILVPSFLMF